MAKAANKRPLEKSNSEITGSRFSTFILGLFAFACLLGGLFAGLYFYGADLGLPESFPTYSSSDDDEEPDLASSTITTSSPSGPSEPEDDEESMPEIEGAFLQFNIDPKGVVLSGIVPDQIVATNLTVASQIAHGDFARSDVTVDSEIGEAPWLESAPELVELLREATDAQVLLTEEGVTYSGSAPSANEAESFKKGLERVTGLPVEQENVAITNQAAPSLFTTANEGKITLTGTLPSEEVKRFALQGAAAVVGEDAVTDSVTVDPNVYWAQWMATVPRVLRILGQFDSFEVNLSGQLATGILRGGVSFNEGEIDLNPETVKLLGAASQVILQDSNIVVTIVGHADAIGSDEANQQLSEERASSVVEYFVGTGVDAGRLTSAGKGESAPIADNSTPEGRAINRRIEFIFAEEPFLG